MDAIQIANGVCHAPPAGDDQRSRVPGQQVGQSDPQVRQIEQAPAELVDDGRSHSHLK
jgi:hypothetical protein